MRVEFDNKIYHLPNPEQAEGSTVLRVSRAATFPFPPRCEANRFRFSHRLSKMLFFLAREGITLTRNKVRASLLQQVIIAERAVVMVFGTDSWGGTFFAVGPQDAPRSDVMSFLNQWCVRVTDGSRFEEFHARAAAYFDRNPDCFDRLYHFSPFAGHDNPFHLADVLEETRKSDNPVVGVRAQSGELCDGEGREAAGQCEQHVTGEGTDLFLAGAGAYACAYILPNVKSLAFHTVIDLNPCLAATVGERYGFRHRETSCRLALSRLRECLDPALVIATYHSTHVQIAEHALSENPKVKILVEKPPVTDHDQLHRLLELRKGGAFIEIGYNRRRAPMAVEAVKLIREKGGGPVVMTCIIKELALPSTHWYYWPTQGTRVTGNLCHWIDLGTAIIEARPEEVTVVPSLDARSGDELTVIVVYEDGSRLTLVATDRGNPLRGVQEHIDIRRDDLTVTIDDFLVMTSQDRGSRNVSRSIIRDKGHVRMYRDFTRRVQDGSLHSYSDRDLLVSSQIYLAVVEAAQNGGGTVSLRIGDACLL